MRRNARHITPHRRRPSALPWRLRHGRKVFCQRSGFPTYEGLRVQDDYGYLVDPRFGGFDIRREGKP